MKYYNQNNSTDRLASHPSVLHEHRRSVFFNCMEVTMIGKEITGFPGYTICKNGNVRSYWTGGCKNRIHDKAKILKPCPDDKGYLKVSLYVNSRRIMKKIHRLLAEAFIPNPRNLPFVLHADDIKININLSNLRWGTKSDNMKDAYLNTQVKKGIPAANTKLTKSQVLEIRKKYAAGCVLQRELAKEYGIHQTHVCDIINRERWTWL